MSDNVIPFPERPLQQSLSLTLEGLPIMALDGNTLHLVAETEELQYTHSVLCSVLEEVEQVMDQQGLFGDECPCPDCQKPVQIGQFRTPCNDN